VIVADGPDSELRGELRVEPDSFLITEGDTMQMTAKFAGNVVSPSQISWTVSPSDVAAIDVYGRLAAESHGQATVTARYRSAQGTSVGTIRATPHRISAVTGAERVGIVARTLPDSLGFRAESEDGVPVPGVKLTFDLPSGGGDLSHYTRITGSDGEARVSWTLGTAAGSQSLRATAVNLGEVTILADALPDYDSARVAPVAGDGQEGVVANYLSEPLMARVTDQFGNLLPGMGLEWSFEAGGGAEVSPGGATGAAPTIRTSADALGLSQVRWRLGIVAGYQKALLKPFFGLGTTSWSSSGSQAGGGNGQKKGWFKWRAKGKPADPDIVIVTPEEAQVVVGEEVELRATLADAFGNAIEGGFFSWRVDNSGSVELLGPGRVKGLKAGRAAVLAEADKLDLTGTAWVSVGAKVSASSVAITPDSLSFSALEKTRALTATAYGPLGEMVSGVTFKWDSWNPAIASVSENGIVTSKAWGQAVIVATATCCSASDTAVVTVEEAIIDDPPFVELTIETTSFKEGVWVGYSARVVNALLLGIQDPEVTVTASDPETVSVTDTALLGLRPGQSWIVGEYADLRDSVAVEVLPTGLESILVNPTEAFLGLGESLDLQVVALDRTWDTVWGETLTWSSSDAGVAEVADGHVTAISIGTATVSASAGDRLGSAFITVSDTLTGDPPFVEVTVDSTSFEERVWVGYSARVVNAHRLGVQDPDVTVTALDPGRILVTETALLGLMPGQTWIVGECAGLRDSVAVEVLATQIETLLLTPAEASLRVGEAVDLDVTALNQAGEAVSGRILTWSSSDPGVVEVIEGHVTAVSPGTATVTATVGESTGSATIAVEVQESPVDPTLTTDPASLLKAQAYEQQFWDKRDLFRRHVMAQLDPPVYTDAEARALGYSSGMGLAAYHTNDELTALARMIEVARDPTRRAAYAAMGVEFLQILVPAIATGEGTGGCPTSSSRFYCSPGYFRYLDAAHGAGAAGFIMNAIYEDPDLRTLYLDDLGRWSNDLVLTLERHFASTEVYGPRDHPHMPAKIAPAHLAIAKVLGIDRYLDAFERITRSLGASADANGGWIGSDVSHASISTTAISLAYREQLRATIPVIITPGQLQGIGEGFVDVAASNDLGYSGTIVGAYGLVVRLSPGVAARAGTVYTFSGSVAGHTLARVFATVAGLAGGYATWLASDPS
jgi:uncharacterized protein YjdB